MKKEIDLVETEAILSKLIGEHCWFVRLGEDRILRMEFGQPHLTFHGPQSLPGTGGTRPSVLQRRVVQPVGQWSLFVEDGLWTVEAGQSACGRDDEDRGEVDRCLTFLSGQRAQEVVIDPQDGSLRLSFDLGGTLRIEFQVDSASSSSWMLFFGEDKSLAQVSRDGFDVEGA